MGADIHAAISTLATIPANVLIKAPARVHLVFDTFAHRK